MHKPAAQCFVTGVLVAACASAFVGPRCRLLLLLLLLLAGWFRQALLLLRAGAARRCDWSCSTKLMMRSMASWVSLLGRRQGGPLGMPVADGKHTFGFFASWVAGVRLRVGGRPRWLLLSCCVRLWCRVCRTVRPVVAGCCSGGVVDRCCSPHCLHWQLPGCWVVWACGSWWRGGPDGMLQCLLWCGGSCCCHSSVRSGSRAGRAACTAFTSLRVVAGVKGTGRNVQGHPGTSLGGSSRRPATRLSLSLFLFALLCSGHGAGSTPPAPRKALPHPPLSLSLSLSPSLSLSLSLPLSLSLAIFLALPPCLSLSLSLHLELWDLFERAASNRAFQRERLVAFRLFRSRPRALGPFRARRI